MKHDEFDIERELRENRPQPRGDYTKTLASEVRGQSPQRTRQGRVGLALALSGLIVVAVASFGGIGYASSSKPAAKQLRIVKSSAANAQYLSVHPKVKAKAQAKAQPKVKPKAAAAAAVKVQKTAPKVTTSQLPFTGLTLWLPLAIGLMLIAFGIALRTRGRRRHTGAH